HRSRRLFRAALAAEAAGRLERADELLAEVAELTADPELRADAIARRSYLLFDRGEFDRAIELARAEADVAAPEIAARVLATGGCARESCLRSGPAFPPWDAAGPSNGSVRGVA